MKKGFIDRNVILQIAEKTKFQDITVEQVYWLTWILDELMLNEFKKDFALMGGSAIVFMYEDMYRLSVDIDIDYIRNPDLGRESHDEIKDLQNSHISQVKQIANKLNLDLKIIDQGSRYLQLQLLYKSVFGPIRSIDLDMGYRYCHSVIVPNNIAWPNIFDDQDWPDFEVQVLVPEEIWASKIIATIGGARKDTDDGKSYLGFKRKIRHLYDTYYLVENLIGKKKRSIDLSLLKSIVLLFGVSRIVNFEFFRGDLLTLYSDKDIEDQLFPVLKIGHNIPSLIELQRKVRRFLDDVIFKLKKDDYLFFEDFASRNFRPERIFNDLKITKRLKSMFFYDEMMGKVMVPPGR